MCVNMCKILIQDFFINEFGFLFIMIFSECLILQQDFKMLGYWFFSCFIVSFVLSLIDLFYKNVMCMLMIILIFYCVDFEDMSCEMFYGQSLFFIEEDFVFK